MNFRSIVLGLCIITTITPHQAAAVFPGQCTQTGTFEMVDIGARLAYIGLIAYLSRPNRSNGPLGLFLVPAVTYAMSLHMWQDIKCLAFEQ